MLRCVAHIVVAPPHQPLPLPLSLLPTIPLLPNSLVQHLPQRPVDALTTKLHVSHLISIPAEDEAIILCTLENVETQPYLTHLKRNTMAPPRPTSLAPPEESIGTTRWSFFGDSDLEGGYCYDLPLVALPYIYDNFSFHASSSLNSTYASL